MRQDPLHLLIASVVLSSVVVVGMPDVVQAEKHCPSPCLAADRDAFTAAGTGIAPAKEGDETGLTERGNSGPLVRRQTRYAPTCTGNGPTDPGVLCSAALTCPDQDQVKFWKWQRQQFDGEWRSWSLVDTVCLGPEDPAIDPTIAIPAIVQRDFQSVVVLKGDAEVSPEPETLVNIATRFTTDAPASYEIPLSILGESVVITATAEDYTWHFGDGQIGTSQVPGGYTEHTYTKARTRQAYVVITWSGSFTVNGSASQPIVGTATTQGTPTDVIVREARSELVRD